MQDVIQLEFLSLVLAAPLLPPGRARALAAGGAIAGGLALAALRAGGEQPMSTLPAGFLAMQGALFVLGAGLGIGAAVAAWESGGSRRPAGAVLSVVGGIGLGLSCVPYLHAADFVPLLAAAVATAAVGFVLAWGAARLGSSSGASQGVCTRRGGLALIGTGVLLATISPWAGPILLGAMVTAAGGWVCAGARDARRLPIAPLLTLTLVPAWWLMRTIAGPEGLATAWLPDLPWSPAAEQLLGALLLLAAWAMSGLWPLQRQEPAALTAPVAALLMARVALPAFPDGLEHWRALVMPVVLVGGLHGMLTGNRSAALAGLAWVGIATAIGPGQAGAGLVLLAGVIFLAAERLGTRLEVAAQLLATLAAGSGALLVTEAGLRTEVVYTVGAVAGLVGFAGRWGAAQASTASALRATLPSV